MTSAEPSYEAFLNNFNSNQTQVLWKWISSDLNTPVSAYLKFNQNSNYSFLLESVEGGAVLGRYSAIGLDPDHIWKHDRDDNTSVIPELKSLFEKCKIDVVPEDLPPMVSSGLFGYLGYDIIRQCEDIPDNNPDSLDIPESILIRPRIMIIFDNIKSRICVSTPIRETKANSQSSPEKVYEDAFGKLDLIVEKLNNPLDYNPMNAVSRLSCPLEIEETTTQEAFTLSVEKAKKYIHEGDIFQVVPSLRFSIPFDLPAFELYRSLRSINPSPFLFYLDFEDFSLVGSSPEILVRVRENIVTIRPIAGTRPRGKTAEQDNELASDLLSDPKERAEHLMLLDLARNDVGKVSQPGSIRVTDQFSIEHYSHVMHIVSNVEGELKEDLDPIDALFSGFPAGTVSGAPKIRAMEIIDELEPVRRGFYGGCIGYMDSLGDVDSCIALRTALVKDGKVIIQAGAGIVSDSQPDKEYEECKNKAKAIIDAAQNAIELSLQKAS